MDPIAAAGKEIKLNTGKVTGAWSTCKTGQKHAQEACFSWSLSRCVKSSFATCMLPTRTPETGGESGSEGNLAADFGVSSVLAS